MKQIWMLLFVLLMLIDGTAVSGEGVNAEVTASGEEKAGTAPDKGRTYTLFASGDTMLARWVPYAYYRFGVKRAVGEVTALVSGADIAMTNLESVTATRGSFFHKGERRPYLYRGRPELLDLITEPGFDFVTLANNHAMDYGPEALLEEIALLDAAGIAHAGAGKNLAEAAAPAYVQAGDVIVAFISLLTGFPLLAATAERPGVLRADEYNPVLEAVRDSVAEARKHADLVVFSPHWGANWTEKPTAKRQELARQIIDLGVDAVIGHSSHQLHGIEVYNGKPILYDVGSFLFDAVKQGRMRHTAGFVLDFNRNGFTRIAVHPMSLHSSRVVPARGAHAEKIQKMMVRMSLEVGGDIDIGVEGSTVVVELPPPGQKETVPSRPPRERIHKTGQTRRLPDHLRQRKSNVVLEKPPEWTAGFTPIPLSNGAVILGARHSEGARPKRAFVSEVVLRAPGPLKQTRWEAFVQARDANGKPVFTWMHPIADGSWDPSIWEKDEVGVDRSLVRPAIAPPEGIYDLFWRMEELEKHIPAKPVDPTQGDKDGWVDIGKILIANKGVPAGPAGVAWDGKLSEKTRERYFPDKGGGAPAWTLVLVPVLSALALAALLLWLRKRRVSKGSEKEKREASQDEQAESNQ